MKLLDTKGWSKKFILVVSGAGMLLTLACGTSAAPADQFALGEATAPAQISEEEAARDSQTEAQSDTMTVTEPSNAAGSETAPELAMDLAPVGNNVGERVPDFAITLVDGSTVTSADLQTQRQPTFLFFFETW